MPQRHQEIAEALGAFAEAPHRGLALLRKAITHAWGGDLARFIAGELLFRMEQGVQVRAPLAVAIKAAASRAGVQNALEHRRFVRLVRDEEAPIGAILKSPSGDFGVVVHWFHDLPGTGKRIVEVQSLGPPQGPEWEVREASLFIG